jgi:hypothetical protein
MANYIYRLALVVILAGVSEIRAADANVVAAGYQLPAAITAAPGQVITVLVEGINVPEQRLSSGIGPWPPTLGGLSVGLTAETASGIKNLVVPIGSIFPFSNCAPTGGSTCGTLTGITLQIPFEMLGPPTSSRISAPIPAAILTISDQAGEIATILLSPTSDQVHIVKTQDTIVGGQGGGSATVVHADGSQVSLSSPAKVGEALVMYAVGLGNTNPTVASGTPTPTSTFSATQPFGLYYDFEPNASPSPGVAGSPKLNSPSSPAPIFVGLTPGFIGLYQVNFLVIAPPSGILPCSGPVISNLTITLTGASSFDGAGICVDLGGS